jgi:hypothetical protein
MELPIAIKSYVEVILDRYRKTLWAAYYTSHMTQVTDLITSIELSMQLKDISDTEYISIVHEKGIMLE